MLQDRIAYRYAKALFELAKEKNQLEQIKDDFLGLDKLYHSSADLRMLLRSPVITSRQKWTIFGQLLNGKVSQPVYQFMEIMTNKGREELLDEVWKAFLELYNVHKNITVAHVKTAIALSPQDRQALVGAIEDQLKTTVDLKETVEEDLIAGFELKIGHKLYDGTVANALRKIKREFALS